MMKRLEEDGKVLDAEVAKKNKYTILPPTDGTWAKRGTFVVLGRESAWTLTVGGSFP